MVEQSVSFQRVQKSSCMDDLADFFSLIFYYAVQHRGDPTCSAASDREAVRSKFSQVCHGIKTTKRVVDI